MSLEFRKFLEENEMLDAKPDEQRRLLPVKKYWKPVLDEETGEVLVDEETGEAAIEPIDEITTKQSFRDSCDVNKILERFQIKNVNAHIVEFPPEVYGEFQNVDLLTAYGQIDRANEIFAALSSEVRAEFGHDALAFVKFASDPENNSRLAELLPAIAKPGAYFPNPHKRGGEGAGAATAPESSKVSSETKSSPPVDLGAEGAGGEPAAT